MSGASVSPELTERLHGLAHRLAESARFAPIADAIRSGAAATIDGAVGSSCALAQPPSGGSNLSKRETLPPGRRLRQERLVDDFVDDLELFGVTDPLRFPAWESDPGSRLVYDEIYGDRLRTLKTLLRQRRSQLIVCSIQSLLQRVPAPDAVLQNSRRIRSGKRSRRTSWRGGWSSAVFTRSQVSNCPASSLGAAGSSTSTRPTGRRPSASNGSITKSKVCGSSMSRHSAGSGRSTKSKSRCCPAEATTPCGRQARRVNWPTTCDTAIRKRVFWLSNRARVELEAQAYLRRHDAAEDLLGIGEARKTMHECGLVEIANLAAAPSELRVQTASGIGRAL